MFFIAGDGIHGRELWKSDGTAAGTVLVKNINPNDSDRRAGSNPRKLTVVDGLLFFTAGDGTHGRELWKSDGTRAGTVLVKNINLHRSGSASSDPSSLSAIGDRLFFSATDGIHGRELWKSDGTRAGTVLVKNINPNASGSAGSHPRSLTAMGRRLFFSAEDGTHGEELWKSDGSRAGTVLVKNIAPAGAYYSESVPFDLTVMGRQLFFSAEDDTHGRELWKSDGSRAGTVLVKDIDPVDYVPHYPGSRPYSLTTMGGRLFFSAADGTRGRELWKSDGTRVGTVRVKDIRPGGAYSDSGPSSLTAMGGRLFFSARDGIHGRELWRSDGSRAGTVLVKNINLNRSGSDASHPRSLTAMGGRLFFSADDGIHGGELWTSDGSTAGTVLVKDIDPCGYADYAYGSRLSSLTAVEGRLFFSADDGIHGEELWTSDGTTEGTILVKDIKTARR